MEIEIGRPIVSIIFPMYNEEDAIYDNLKSVLSVLGKISVVWELFIIDDGSTDGSKEQAQKALKGLSNAHVISYKPNRGRGFALRKGFEAAKGNYIITTESDLSWGSEIIPKLLEPLLNKEADAVIASPYIQGGSLVNVPFKRRFLSRYGNKILTFGLSRNITMATGMTRGYRREMLESIILSMDGKEIHLEIIYKLIAIGAKIKEIPGTITWKDGRDRSKKHKSSLRVKKLILSHFYFSLTESPIHFIGSLGLIFLGLGLIGILAIIGFKIIGFSLLHIPYFPHYVFASIIVGLLIVIFSLISLQIRNFQREFIRMYAQIVKLSNTTRAINKVEGIIEATKEKVSTGDKRSE